MSWVSPMGEGPPVIRSDPWGVGSFAARRSRRQDDGTTVDVAHLGVDLSGTPGQFVHAPHDGLVKRWNVVYPQVSRRRFQLVEIEVRTRGFQVLTQLLYVEPMAGDPIKPGTAVYRGQPIALLLDVSELYDRRMKPHLHWQVSVARGLVHPGDDAVANGEHIFIDPLSFL